MEKYYKSSSEIRAEQNKKLYDFRNQKKEKENEFINNIKNFIEEKKIPKYITKEKNNPVNKDSGFFSKVDATAKDLKYHLYKGLMKGGLEAPIDYVVGLGGWIGSLFGADDQWAKDFIDRDYTSTFLDTGVLTGNMSFQEINEKSFLEGNKIGDFIREGTESIGNMLPSIALTPFTGGVTSMIYFGTGAAGNATESAIKEGHDLDSALLYGTVSGILEAGIESVFGGIGGLGKGIVSKTIGKKIISETSSKLMKSAAFRLISSMIGEGIEEVASTAIDPYLQRLILQNDIPNATKEELLHSFVMGATISTVLQGSRNLIKKVHGSSIHKDFAKINIETGLYDTLNEKYQKYVQSDAFDINSEINTNMVQRLREHESSIVEKLEKMYKTHMPQEYEKIKSKTEEFKKSFTPKTVNDLNIKKNDDITSKSDVKNEVISDLKNKLNILKNDKNSTAEDIKFLENIINQYDFSEKNNKTSKTLDFEAPKEYNNIKENKGDNGNDIGRIQERNTIGSSEISRISNDDQIASNQLFRRETSEFGDSTDGIIQNRDRRGVQKKSESSRKKLDVGHNLGLKKVSGEEFYYSFSQSKTTINRAPFVVLKSIEDYNKNTNYVIDNGNAGLSIKPNGDIVSVFRGENGKKGALKILLPEAIKNGGNKLDCFNVLNGLANLYSRYGFIPVAKTLFNREYAPEGWNYERDGQPDIVFMVHDGVTMEYDSTNDMPHPDLDSLPYIEYDEGIKYQENALKKSLSVVDKSKTEKTGESIEDTKIININNSISNTKDIPADYVKAWADLNENQVFDKTVASNIIDSILNDVKKNGKITIKGGKKVLVDVLFQKLNRASGADLVKIVDDIANHIVEYASYNKSGALTSMDDKEFIKESLKSEIMNSFINDGKPAKMKAYKTWVIEKFRNLHNQIGTLKKINKQINKVLGITQKLKDMSKRKYPGTGDIIAKNFQAMSGLLGKIKRADYISGKVRSLIKEYGEKFYNDTTALKNDYLEYIDPNILADIELIASKSASKASLALDEVMALKNILNQLRYTIKNFDTMFIDGKKTSIEETATRGVEIVSKTQKFKNHIHKFLRFIYNPRLIFQSLESYNVNGVLTKSLYEIKKGETKQMGTFMDLMEPFDAFSKKNKKYIKSHKDTYITINGIDINRGQALSLYQLSKREQALTHLYGDGISIKTDKNTTEHIKITENDIVDIEKKLSDTDKEYLDIVEDFFNNHSKTLKEKTDYAFQGYSSIDENFYFPISSDFNSTYKSIGDPRSGFRNLESVFGYSFNKDIVKGAKNEISISSISNVIDKHALQLSRYASLLIPIKNLNLIFNKKVAIDNDTTTTLRQEVAKVWDGAYKYIDNLIKDITGTTENIGEDKIFAKIRSNYAKYQLGLNGKVILNQLTAIPLALTMVSTKNLTKAAFMKNNSKTRLEMDKYSSFSKYRNYESSIIKSQGLINTWGAFTDTLMKGMSATDRYATGLWWNAAQLEIQDKSNLKLNTEENKIEAGKLLEELIRTTQPNSSASERPSFLRSPSELIKSFAMFTSQPLQMVSMIAEGAHKISFAKNNIKTNGENESNKKLLENGKKQFTSSLVAVGTSSILLTAVSMLMSRFLGRKDEEETIAQEILSDFGGNVIGMIPIVKDFYGMIVNDYEITNSTFDAINQLGDTVKVIFDNPDGFDLVDARKFLYSLGQITGLPTRNFLNYSLAFSRTFNPEIAYKTNSLFYKVPQSNHIDSILDYSNKGNERMAMAVYDSLLKDNGTEINSSSVKSKMVSLISKGFLKALPKPVRNKFSHDGIEYTLSKSQKNKVIKYYSEVEEEAVKLVSYPQFKLLTEDEQANALKTLYEEYYFYALNNVLNLDENLSFFSLKKQVPIHKHITHISKIKNIKNTNDISRKNQIKNYINKIPGFTREQKHIIYSSLGYSS